MLFDKKSKYTTSNGIVNMQYFPDYQCTGHEEADTKIVFFKCQIVESKNIIVRCSDTDVVICLGNIEYVNSQLKVVVQFGSGNHERFINITKLTKALGLLLCAALPAFHAFTGCNYNSAFYKKAKNKSFTILKNSITYQEAFKNINDEGNEATI